MCAFKRTWRNKPRVEVKPEIKLRACLYYCTLRYFVGSKYGTDCLNFFIVDTTASVPNIVQFFNDFLTVHHELFTLITNLMH